MEAFIYKEIILDRTYKVFFTKLNKINFILFNVEKDNLFEISSILNENSENKIHTLGFKKIGSLVKELYSHSREKRKMRRIKQKNVFTDNLLKIIEMPGIKDFIEETFIETIEKDTGAKWFEGKKELKFYISREMENQSIFGE